MGCSCVQVIREHMAWMKIIIISGYNDFQYAQTAIKLGVTEYLLKPVSVQDLQSVLAKVADVLDQEKSERAYLKRMRSQVEDNLSLLREKFLLRLVTGGESSILGGRTEPAAGSEDPRALLPGHPPGSKARAVRSPSTTPPASRSRIRGGVWWAPTWMSCSPKRYGRVCAGAQRRKPRPA